MSPTSPAVISTTANGAGGGSGQSDGSGVDPFPSFTTTISTTSAATTTVESDDDGSGGSGDSGGPFPSFTTASSTTLVATTAVESDDDGSGGSGDSGGGSGGPFPSFTTIISSTSTEVPHTSLPPSASPTMAPTTEGVMVVIEVTFPGELQSLSAQALGELTVGGVSSVTGMFFNPTAELSSVYSAQVFSGSIVLQVTYVKPTLCTRD